MISTFGKIVSAGKLTEGIYDLLIETDIAKESKPGQFVMVYTDDPSLLLGRPISICQIDKEASTLRLVFRVVGKGTAIFAKWEKGQEVRLLGPCGNGFPIDETTDRRIAVLGGGIGLPPVLGFAKASKNAKSVTAILGYRNNDTFLKNEFEKVSDTLIATEDGSVGTKGNVVDVLNEHKGEYDVLFACGPMPMLRAIKKYASEQGIKAYISLEEKMACGVGACLGCVAKTTKEDKHSHVNNTRVCTEGPVFEAGEVEI